MRHKRLLFVFVLCLWVMIPKHLLATAHQCTFYGAVEQDNFNINQSYPDLNGWYCSSYQNDARDIVMNEAAVRCDIDCQECGGTYTNVQYQANWSAAPGDSYATNSGCTSSQYGEYYHLDCTCSWPPPTCAQDGSACSSASECCSGYCNTDGGSCGLPGSPILINLKDNSSNYHLTSAADGVLFDIDHNGQPNRIAWTQAESMVAFLVLDRNQNGRIDNGGELFGNFTLKRDGHLAANGFDALLDLDGGPGASDGKIDRNDQSYADLRLWLDRNHNGYSEPDELLTLSDAGVDAVFTSYRETPRVDRYGNQYRYEGLASMSTRGGESPRKVFDVFFAKLN
jgi:hypothetical protein